MKRSNLTYSASTSTQKISQLCSGQAGWQLKLSAKDQPQGSAETTFDIVLFNNLTGDRLTAKYEEHNDSKNLTTTITEQV